MWFWRRFLQFRHARQFWIGVLIYVLSFLFVAIAGVRTGSGGPALGYDCAWTTLLFSWELIKSGPRGLSSMSALDFSFAVSGWINIVFLAFIAIVLSGRANVARKALRTAILLMIPFCWIVFHYERLLPREGHFLWIAGMVLALFLSRNESTEEHTS